MNNLKQAMAEVQKLHDSHGITQRGGKKYTQVVHRMEAMRSVFGLDLGVETKILVDDGQRVVVQALITLAQGGVVGSGMAEEIRGQGNVNKTSALENCETSAIGRALASIGLAGGEYASANEIDAVPRKQEALNSQNQGGAPAPTQSPPSVKAAPPVSQPITTQKELDDADNQDSRDIDLYKDVKYKLSQCKMKSHVHETFNKYKVVMKQVKERSPERAQHLMALFQEAEAKFN